MISLEENKACMYPKIDTLYDRDKFFKVDRNKLRNPEIGLIKKFDVTEKIDGTNIRILWKDKELAIMGRTERAELPHELVEWIEANITPSQLETVFGDKEVVLYGEGYGGKIQGNVGYTPHQKFILFDVRVGRYWLTREVVEDIAASLGIEAVPYLGQMTIEEITDFVSKGFPSKIGEVKVCEGIIAKTDPVLYDNKLHRLIFKLKHKDF